MYKYFIALLLFCFAFASSASGNNTNYSSHTWNTNIWESYPDRASLNNCIMSAHRSLSDMGINPRDANEYVVYGYDGQSNITIQHTCIVSGNHVIANYVIINGPTPELRSETVKDFMAKYRKHATRLASTR